MILKLGKIFRYKLILVLSAFATLLNAQNLDKNTILFISDTQQPTLYEKIFHKTDRNIEASKAMLNIISNAEPKAVFMLGDLVGIATKDKAWNEMDYFLNRLRKKNIPVHSAIGNHEYLLFGKKGYANFIKRFPDYSDVGNVYIEDSVAIVLFNSNFKKLTKSKEEEQLSFYKAQLNIFQNDPSVKAIIVGCHHPPYTNGAAVGSDLEVRNVFVKEFLKYSKCKLFLTGHSHNYEWFNIEGKDLMVIGGGGATKGPYKPGSAGSESLVPNYNPPYHYLTITRNNNKLEVKSWKLSHDFKSVSIGHSIIID